LHQFVLHMLPCGISRLSILLGVRFQEVFLEQSQTVLWIEFVFFF
jgi:hypothetical protein